MTTYTYTTLADPLATNGTYASDINDAGQIVGGYAAGGFSHAFLYSNRTYTTLDFPGAYYTSDATGINDAGDIVGNYVDASSYAVHGFLYSGGTYTTIDDPLATNGTYVTDINDEGQIVGGYNFSPNYPYSSGFVYTGGVYATVSPGVPFAVAGINDAGQIVGSYSSEASGSSFSVVGTADTSLQNLVGDLGSGRTSNSASGINDAGQIVGSYTNAAGDVNGFYLIGNSHGFLYSNGTYTTLDDPLSTRGTSAAGINDSGQIVGNYADDSGTHAFVADSVDTAPAAPTGLTIDDIRDAGLLAVAAYGKQGATAEDNLQATGLKDDGWQYVNPAAFESTATVINGYYVKHISVLGQNIFDAEIMLSFNSTTNTLAIAFRGTDSVADILDDIFAGLVSWGYIYDQISGFVTEVITGAAAFGASRILITGHSLGGAMVEEAMAAHPDANISGVSFGSPGVQNITNTPGSDERLINIGHVDLDNNGDPIYRSTDIGSYVHVMGGDIHVNLSDEIDYPHNAGGVIAVAVDIGQHDGALYAYSAAKIADELDTLLSDGLPFDVRTYNYVVGTQWSPLGVVNGGSGNDVLIGDARLDGTSTKSQSRNDLMNGAAGTTSWMAVSERMSLLVDSAMTRYWEFPAPIS